MKKIALVDDDEDSNILLKIMLENHYQVFTYIDAEKALEDFQKKPPDIVLLDIAMPKINGVEVLSRLRNHEKLQHIKIVALTAYSLHGDRDKYLKLGFNAYISKPILDEEAFLHILEQIISKEDPKKGHNNN